MTTQRPDVRSMAPPPPPVARAPPRNEPAAPAAPDAGISLPSNPAPPAKILTTDAAVAAWPQTPGYQAIIGWLKRRAQRIRGKEIMAGESTVPAVTALISILDKMIAWVEEVPLQPHENQRFGNLAFREYIALVEKRLPPLLCELTLPPHLQEQLLPLLLKSHSFGHPTRMDYGSGHELAFVLGLWCCVVSGWVGGEDAQDELILRVFPRYLDLTTLLQSTYRLEPAGSHGVWGLDDYCFLPYYFGSAQLLGSDMSPAAILKEATTTKGPFTDLYSLTLHRISLFKHGAAFSEHSPLLDSLSQFPSWAKPHSGLLKMFQAEVLGKRVVVQGLWIGGWCWGEHMPKPEDGDATRSPFSPMTAPGVTTAAPWKTQQVQAANRSWSALPNR